MHTSKKVRSRASFALVLSVLLVLALWSPAFAEEAPQESESVISEEPVNEESSSTEEPAEEEIVVTEEVELTEEEVEPTEEILIEEALIEAEEPVETEELVQEESQSVEFEALGEVTFTVTFMVDGAEYVLNTNEVDNFAPQTVVDGAFINEPVPPTPPAGKVSFLGWSLTGSPNDYWSFSSNVVTSDITLYAVFSVDYLVSFVDNDGKVVHTLRALPGETFAPPQQSVIDNLPRPAGSSASVRLLYWEYISDGTAWAWVFNTTQMPTYDVTLRPVWGDAHVVVFDSLGGSYVQPQLPNHGSSAIQPTDPTRIGYTFAHWSLSSDGSAGAFDFSSAITADTTLYAIWTAQPVNYTLVYWLEKPNILGDPGTDTSQYAFYKSVQGTGADAGSQLNFTAGQLDTVPYATYSFTISPFLRGDGASVVNVYFKRNVYTLSFDLNTTANATNSRRNFVASMVLNGQTYQQGYNVTTSSYSFQTKYEQNISNLWPSGQNATIFENGQTYSGGQWGNVQWQFTGWTSPNTASVLVTHRLSATSDLLPASGNTIDFRANWSGFATVYQVNYYFERLPDQTGGVQYSGKWYVLNTEYTQSYASDTSSLSPKDIEGVSVVNSASQTTNPKNFYYDRNRSGLSFNLQGAPAQSGFATISDIMYEQNLAGFEPADPVWEDSSGKTLYFFREWYLDAQCSDGKEFSFETTMPNGNLAIFAKWESAENIVKFYDGIGGNYLEGRDVGAATGATIGDPNIYTFGQAYEGKGEFQGWVWLAEGSYPVSFVFGGTTVQSDLNVYATWKTTGFSVSYNAGAGSGTVPTDTRTYNLSEIARIKDGQSLTPPTGQVFYGWTVSWRDGLVYPYNLLPISGTTELIAFYGNMADSVSVTYLPTIADDLVIETEKSVVSWRPKNQVAALAGEIFTSPAGQLIGWDTDPSGETVVYSLSQNVQFGSNTTLYGVWATNSYIVTWNNWDGSLLEQDLDVLYGATPSYDGAVPSRATDALNTYAFSGWSPAISPVTGNITYTAQFTATLIPGDVFYNVTWNNWDGSLLEQDLNVPLGANPSYDSATPTKAEDADFTYAFSGWSPAISPVAGNITYTAQFGATPIAPVIPDPPVIPVDPPATPAPPPAPPAGPLAPPVTPAPPVTVIETPDPPAAAPAAPNVPPAGENDEEAVISDVEPPRAIAETSAWALLNLILTLLGIIIALVLLLAYLFRRNSKSEIESYQDETETKTKRLRFRVVNGVAAIVALVAFFLTEDMTQPMVFVDRWTILHVIIFILQVVFIALATKKTVEDGDEEDAGI